MEWITVENNLLLLRITAFLGCILFVLHYVGKVRIAWTGFVIMHSIHGGFIISLGLLFGRQFSTVGLIVGGLGYVVMYFLAGIRLRPKELATRFAWLDHYIWFVFISTFALHFIRNLGAGSFRIHSLLGIILLAVALMARIRKG